MLARRLVVTRKLVGGCMLALGGVLGLVLGCPLELQRGLSCGDGWWDPEFEECDPRDVDAPYRDACRERGFDVDAVCDPQTCTIRASDEDCLCRLDEAACEQVCGDGLVQGHEECEPGIQGGFKVHECINYMSTATPIRDKHYAWGNVGSCNADNCTFGRNGCSFCGDGVVDPAYTDWLALEGTQEFPAEVCDGAVADEHALDEHCEMKCIGEDEDPPNGDVVLRCDFECAPDCSGFAPLNDVVVPGQDAAVLGCCVAKGSPCPQFGGVPQLSCCSWLENSKWLDEKKCVPAITGGEANICP
jgi:hypothetical protein